MRFYGVIKKAGSFYSFEDVRLGQGRENSKAFLREHRDVSSSIENLIRTKLGMVVPETDNVDGAATVTE